MGFGEIKMKIYFKDIQNWEREDLIKAVELFANNASWFCHNLPGTPVPEWCVVSTPVDVELVRELWSEYATENLK